MSQDREPEYRPGVGIVLLNRDHRVWVGRRIGMPPGLPAWQMPQGGIDVGETPLEAAWRELLEETGTDRAELLAESRQWLQYDLPDIVRTGWRRRFRGQRQKWFLMRFTGDDINIDINGREPEFDAWKWVEPAALPRLVVDFKRAVYGALLDEFREQLGL